MSSSTRTFVGADENLLVADHYGDRGQPVILVHGGGQTRHAWGGTAKQLAGAGLQAFCLDQRGHGDSAWVEQGGYHFSDFGADLVAVAEQVRELTGVIPISIGASLGGLASMLAEGNLKPGCLAGVVLVDVTPRLDAGGVNKIVSFMSDKAHEGFESVEEAADVIAAYLPHRKRPKSLDGLSKNLRRHNDGRYRWHWDPRFMNYHVRDRGVEDHVQDDLLKAAAALKVPSLLVRGARSELVREEHVAEFLDLVPHAQFTDVKGAGHMVAGDENDVFTSAVLSFLEEYHVWAVE